MQIYKYEDYTRDILKIKERIDLLIQRGHTPHLIALFRGSLPMATHLSNMVPCEMSIINFQKYDAPGGVVKDPRWILNLTSKYDTLIVLDDIFDTGTTIEKVKSFLREHHSGSYIEYHVLVGSEKAEEAGVFRYTEHDGDWVVFPWEMDADMLNKEQ